MGDGDSFDVLATFVEDKAGYCVHFAAAMAVMSRDLGIPARIAVGYQDEAGERAIVERMAGASTLVEPAVTLTRRTREHAQVRMGASVRGAIDLVRLGRELSGLRGEPDPVPGDATFADAAIAALSGRLRLQEGSDATAEAIVRELIDGMIPRPDAERLEEPKGKAEGLLPEERAVR